jgi:hypothetical protein
MIERSIQTAPTTPVLRLQAEVYWRGLGSSGYESISKFKQSIGSLGEAGV